MTILNHPFIQDREDNMDADHHCPHGHRHFDETNIRHCTLCSRACMMTDSALESDDRQGRSSNKQTGKRIVPHERSQQAQWERPSTRSEYRHRHAASERRDTKAKPSASGRPERSSRAKHTPQESRPTDQAEPKPYFHSLADYVIGRIYTAGLARVEAATKGTKRKPRKYRAELSEHRGHPDEAPHSSTDSEQSDEEEQAFQEWWDEQEAVTRSWLKKQNHAIEEEEAFQEWWDEQEAITKSWLERQNHAPNPTASFYDGKNAQNENHREMQARANHRTEMIDKHSSWAKQSSHGPIHSNLQVFTKLPPFKVRREYIDAMNPNEGLSDRQQTKADRKRSKHVTFDMDPDRSTMKSKPSSRPYSGGPAKIAVQSEANTTSSQAVIATDSAVQRLKPDARDNNNNKPKGEVKNSSELHPVHTQRKEQPTAPTKTDSIKSHGRPASIPTKVDGHAGPPVPPKVPVSISNNEQVPPLPTRPPKQPVSIMKKERVVIPPVKPPKTPIEIPEKEEILAQSHRRSKFSSHYEEWNDWVNLSNEHD